MRGTTLSRKKKSRNQVARKTRVPAVALATGFAATTALVFPFYPHSWAFGLALMAAAVTAVRPRLGLMVALAVPILPLGNVSLGLAIVYAALAAGWLLLHWNEPDGGLVFSVGALLGPVAALGLIPLATLGMRAAPRRAATALAAVVVGAVVAGVRHSTLPFTRVTAPRGIGVAGARGAFDVAGSLSRAATAHPSLVLGALVVAAAAVAFPYAVARGRLGAVALVGGVAVGALLAVPLGAVLPLVLAGCGLGAAAAFAKPSAG